MFPYPHILVHDVFPRIFTERLRRHLPPSSAYKSLKAMGRVERQLPRYPVRAATDAERRCRAVRALPQLLGRNRALVAGRSVSGKSCCRNSVRSLAQRFENPQRSSSITKRSDPGSHRITRWVRIPIRRQRCFPSCFICRPTLLCRTSAPRCICRRTRRLPVPAGRITSSKSSSRLLTMPYVPNTLVRLHEDPNAFHGVEPIAEPDIERALLLYDIKVRKDPAAVAPESHNADPVLVLSGEADANGQRLCAASSHMSRNCCGMRLRAVAPDSADATIALERPKKPSMAISPVMSRSNSRNR